VRKEEGHWRFDRHDKNDDRPWPEPRPGWRDRERFLEQLGAVQSRSMRLDYRGFSMCRLCGQRNGSHAYLLGDWEWPEGYRHYIEKHDVRPTAAFQGFISSAAASGLRYGDQHSPPPRRES
jgi:hypothetical protein